MPSYKQDEEFATEIVEYKHLLDKAIEWIANNLEPEDVFSSDALGQWAEAVGYEKET